MVTKSDIYSLSAGVFQVVLLPRIACRLRALAADKGKSPEHVASILIARALIPNSRKRALLIEWDLADAGLDDAVVGAAR